MRFIAVKRLSAVLLCALTLLSCVTAVNAEQTDTDGKGDRIMVSLGDSYASGEGIEKFYGQDESTRRKIQNQDWVAHRSTKSWSGQLKLDGISGTMADHKDENWFFVATSGAETRHLTETYRKNYDFDGYEGYLDIDRQLSVFQNLGDKKAEYVTVSLGGNDAKFSEVVTSAATNFLEPATLNVKLAEIWNEFYNGTPEKDSIRERLYQAYHDIADAAGQQAKIIVVGYPKLLDEDGSGFLFSKEDAALINDSVSRFNKEIEAIVNTCKSEGMKICFVSVENAFEGHGAYSDDPYIRKVEVFKQSQDIKGGISAYSMHPNEKGAAAYAECVQKKIDSIEKDDGASEWPLFKRSDEREVVLVLDVSGSMAGNPLAETVTASEKFIDTVLDEDASVGVVTYDSSAMCVANFSSSADVLKKAVGNISSGGDTNMDAGLSAAYDMLSGSTAQKRIIVLMSDGEPNKGRVGDELISYAKTLKDEGIYIYTLGFFGSAKSAQQALMEAVASDGCHYEVENADDLKFFFGDIADQINGQRYTYIRIACPVDVTVTFDGQKLCSKSDKLSTRTDFGTLTFEESGETYDDENVDGRVKVLRLKTGEDYEVKIEGTARGRMDYTISFADENGEYTDTRTFEDIKITKRTEIFTVAAETKKTTLRVDEDGDGKTDITYQAKSGEIGAEVTILETVKLVIIIAAAVMALVVICIIVAKKKKRHI